MQTKRTSAITVILIFAFIFFARALSLIPIVIDDDEAWFSASAASLRVPGDFFSKALDNKPPGTVWFYWLVEKITHCGSDPRPARFFSILLAGLTAYLIVRCVRLISTNKQNSWLAGAVFLMVSALPHPQMFAATTENLMLPLICLSMCIAFEAISTKSTRGIFLTKISVAAASLSLLLFLKQTAVFFFIPAFYALVVLWRQKKLKAADILIVAAAGLFVQGVCFWMLHWNWQLYWYWTMIYPSTVLKAVRAEAFHETSAFFWNSLLVFIFTWPLLKSCKSKAVVLAPAASRNLLFIWIASAFAAIAIGKGLFFHYFLYLMPPICVAFGLAIRDMKKLKWFAYPYFVSALIVAIPASGMFWGVDLNYYARLGAKVRELVPGKGSIFVWGGNALSLVSSKRNFATRFVTARFAAPPYATSETQVAFKSDFLRDPPSVVVDLHERGDCRFALAPAEVEWFARELKRNYVVYEDASIPWAKFYRYRGPSRILASAAPQIETNASFFDFESVYRAMARSFGKNWFHAGLLRRWDDALTMGIMLQAWDGLRVLVGANPALTHDPEIRHRYQKLELALKSQIQVVAHGSHANDSAREEARSMMKWISAEFERRQQPLPLSLESPSWWVSLALVKMQPRTDSPTQRTL